MVISVFSNKHIDEKFGFYMLRSLPEKAGLIPYADPIIHSFPNKQAPDELGLSGLMMMIESHCAFHWWPAKNYMNITISSCKPIRTKLVIQFLEEIFGTEAILCKMTSWPEEEV